MQVASPPPRRVDGTTWLQGLVVNSGDAFDPRNPPADGQVFPIGGTAPLGQPDPRTIVLDRWFVVPQAPDDARTFSLGPAGPKDEPLSFRSIAYPDPTDPRDGVTLSVVEVDYCFETTPVPFDREVNIAVDGVWVAVSLERFFPPGRASAESIVRVMPEV